MHIKGTDGHTLHNAIHDNVATGTTIYTDELSGYSGIGGIFYSHGRVNHSAKQYVNGMASTNSIESVWAVMKRGYNGVYHNWSSKHMTRYINEFSFRLNEGSCVIDTQDRLNSLFGAMANKTITYAALTA